MKLVNIVFSVLIIPFFIQLALRVLEKDYDLELCHGKILIRSGNVIAISLLAAVVAACVGWFKGESSGMSELLLYQILLCGMGVLSVTDLQKHVLPNRFLLLMAAMWLLVIAGSMICDISHGFQLLAQSLFGGALGAVIFGVCYLLVRKQLGAGDVKLAIVMGLYLTGTYALSAYLIGTICCCVYSMIRVVQKKLGWKDGVAMAPFLMIGVWITLLIS